MVACVFCQNFVSCQSEKETIYHELGHASHYRQVGEDFWLPYRAHIVANGGYSADGNGNFNPGSSPGHVAVGEAWGFHIGPTVADWRYGLEHSNTVAFGNRGRFINLLEGGRAIPCNQGLCNFDLRLIQGFIPRGLIHDLLDNNILDYPDPNAFEDLLVTDDVAGFSNEIIFQNLLPATTTINTLENNISQNLPPGVLTDDLQVLFNSYE